MSPLAWRCARRYPLARLERGDIWRADWSRDELVDRLQRPVSKPCAIAKARAELRPEAYPVSLEFEAVGQTPVARLEGVRGKPVWVYQLISRYERGLAESERSSLIERIGEANLLLSNKLGVL